MGENSNWKFGNFLMYTSKHNKKIFVYQVSC